MTVKLALLLFGIAVAWALMTLLVLLVFTLPDCHGDPRCIAQKDVYRPLILALGGVSYVIVAALVVRSGEGRK